jgi:HlyD family secretion protein
VRTTGIVWTLILAAAVGSAWAALQASRSSAAEMVVTTAPVTRGDIVDNIWAIGTAEPVSTVQVGAEVSAAVVSLDVDFNSVVRAGQTLARLDSSVLKAEAEQARLRLVAASAGVDLARLAAGDKQIRLERTAALRARGIAAKADVDAARVAWQAATTDLRAAEAAVEQARAALLRAQGNLEKATIRSPVSGVVIARNVELGQMVSARLQAPTLFEIATDTHRMRVRADIDESDTARVRVGQTATMTFDALPGEELRCEVVEVRLQPVVNQGVVSYPVLIDVPNPRLEMRPGMTAKVSFEVARRDDVLRIPNAALAFRPTAEAAGLLDLAAAEEEEATGAEDAAGVWVKKDGEGARLVPVELGMTDGLFTELTGGNLAEGSELVTAVFERQPPPVSLTNNPLAALSRRSRGRFRHWR